MTGIFAGCLGLAGDYPFRPGEEPSYYAALEVVNSAKVARGE
ncbi:MAG: hypothetical protein WBW33_33305 [Bryobacteraceae bacterium]